MKVISKVEEKPFTPSLNICPDACCRKGLGFGRSDAFPFHNLKFSRSPIHEHTILLMFLGIILSVFRLEV
jgi:hypothetical protein